MMKYEGHTPKPWYWSSDNGWLVADDPEDEDGGSIVLAPDLDNAMIPYDPDDPDYALVADAPLLLELVQMCLEYFEDPDHAPVQPYELERKIKEVLE